MSPPLSQGIRLRWWVLALPAFVAALAALAVGLFIVWRTGEQVIERQQTAIAESARDYFVGFAREEGVSRLAKALDHREQVRSPDGFRYALIDNDGRILGGADVLGALDTPPAGWSTVVEPDRTPKRVWRVLTQPLGAGQTLLVAENLDARDAFRASFVKGSALALMFTALVGAIVSIAVSSMLLRRAGGIADTARRIANGDLSARAPVRERGDVFDALGASLNAMLDRYDELTTSLRTVTDSVTHDLRSPLMRMKFALERAGADGASEAARLTAIEEAQAEADSSLATLSALMDIARAETGLSRDMMAPVDLIELVDEMGELFAPVLEDAGQTLTIEEPAGPVTAVIHERLLRQAIGNLLHNAAIHAGEGATVRLEARVDAAGLMRLTVADNGPGVPADHLGRVQERFVRLDASRSTPGSGLGLAIVAACAKLHGGRLVLEDNGPGLKAVLEMPAHPA